MKHQFWCTDPKETAAQIQPLWPQRVQEVIRTANDIMDGTFTFQDHWEMECCPEPVHFGPDPRSIQWDRIPFGDPEWLYAFNRHTIFLNLAKAWAYTGESRYVSRLAGLMEDWIDRNPLSAENETNVWRSLEAGLRCEFWLRTLQLVSDSPLFSDSLLEKVENCLLVHGDYLVLKSTDFQKFSNWGVLQDHGLFLLGVWFDRQDWIQLSLERLDLELHRQIMDDGVHWEHSPMYHCEVLHCAVDTVVIARQNGIVLPRRFEDNVRKMCHAILGMVSPDGVLLCQGDTDAIDARNEMALGALLFGDAQLRCVAGEIPFPENLWDLGQDAFRLKDLSVQAPDLSYAQADSGNFMLRSDGQPDSAYLHFYCGPIGGGHGHADQLHIDAGIGGETVLMDSGRYTYLDTPLRMSLKSPGAHNTTTVDHADFTVGQDTWSWSSIAVPLKGDYRFTPQADFVSGRHLGYLDRGVVAAREILWLRSWKTAVIFDQFHTQNSQAHTYQQYFHFGKGKVSPEGNRVHWQGTRGCADLISMGDVRCSMDVVPCSLKYNELSQCDRLTVEQENTGFTKFITILDLNADIPLRARPIPVTSAGGDLSMRPEIQALELLRGDERAVVMLRCGEAVPPRALLHAGGYEGYGRAVVFTDNCPDGLSMAW